VLLLAEQLRRQHLWYWVPATLWWVLRLIVEVAYALVLTLGLRHLPDNLLDGSGGIFVGIVAGIAGPRVFGRPQLAFHGINFNVINAAYVRLTKPLDEEIDESSAEVERLYINEVVRPAAREGLLVPDDIADDFKQHLSGRRLMSDADRIARLAYIQAILDDEIPDDEKVAALVFRVYQIGAYRALQGRLKPLRRRRYGVKLTAEKIGRLFKRKTSS